MSFEPIDTIPGETTQPATDALTRAFDSGANLRLDIPDVAVVGDSGAPRRRGRPKGSTNAARTPRNVAGAKQLGDLFITGFILLVSFTIGDWAAPTPVESDAIARPLGNILARRIDLAAKLGKDADDVIALVIAMTIWMSRVGPIAMERTRDAWNERQQRRAAGRVDGPPESVYPGGTAGMDAGGNDQASSAPTATGHPFDAIAKARGAAFRGIDAYPSGNSG